MDSDYIKAIKQWEKEYPTMEVVKLRHQQIRILNKGPEHNEGMVYGTMYNDWKTRRGYND